MRWSRIAAIAWRDLRIEFAGRGGRFLPGVSLLLLLPLAGSPPPPSVEETLTYPVAGDVPPDVAEDPAVVVDPSPFAVWFQAPGEDGQWVLRGLRIATPIRERMDAREARVPIEVVKPPPLGLPKRSLLLALVASSVLTGALSQSIPGERSQGTLESLLTSAISRFELVAGKWLAWGGYGAFAGLIASVIAILRGVQDPGWWLLSLPWVSLGTVAMGLYLVRRANDVVGGATVALRMLPAALGMLGLAAWVLGGIDPLLGASVPIGGALVATADTWPGALPVLWSIVVTGTSCAALLAATARDLEAREGGSHPIGVLGAIVLAGVAATAWWTPLLGSLLWLAGDAPERTDVIPRSASEWAAVGTLATVLGIRMARTPSPAAAFGWLPGRRPLVGLAAASVVGLALAALGPAHALLPLPDVDLLGRVATRFADASSAAHAGLAAALLAIVVQETLFRGWIRRHAGEAGQVVLSTIVLSPLDPIGGALSAVALGGLVRLGGGSVLPAIVARAVAALAAVAIVPWVTPAAALGVGLAAAVLVQVVASTIPVVEGDA